MVKMDKHKFLKDAMGTVIYINGIPFMLKGSSLSDRESDGYLDAVTMEVTPLRFNDTNGEQTKWYTQIEQPVVEIQTTTDATFGLYLTCAEDPQFKEAYKKQFLQLISSYDDTVNKNLESNLISENKSTLILELTRTRILKEWNLDYTLQFEIKQIKNG